MVGISVWDNKENADAYSREGYPEVQRLLSKVIEGTPEVRTYEVSVSTFPKLPLGAGQPESHRHFQCEGRRSPPRSAYVDT